MNAKGDGKQRSSGINNERLDKVVAQAQRDRLERGQGYREQALKMYPWVCGRCSREFDNSNLRELTVHHRDHDHDNNPDDGSNWELLCLYCHDQEHTQQTREHGLLDDDNRQQNETTHRPFAGLSSLLDTDKD